MSIKSFILFDNISTKGELNVLRYFSGTVRVCGGWNLKAAQMNVQGYCLIRKLMLNKFGLGHNAPEENQNIYIAKVKGAVYHNTLTKRLKNFLSSFKNLDCWARSSRIKIGYSDGAL